MKLMFTYFKDIVLLKIKTSMVVYLNKILSTWGKENVILNENCVP